MNDSRTKRAVLAMAAILTALFALILSMPQKAQADPVSKQNVEVNATATGGVNGPYTITLTAQQTRAPQSGEVNWDGSTKIRYALGPLLDGSNAEVTVSDDSATAEFSNDYLEVTGYDYSANIGTPLTVTISGIVADNWNVNQDSYGLLPGFETPVPTWSSWCTLLYDTGGHFIDFPDTMVEVMRLAAPEVTWEGKTISWDAVTGATSYDLVVSSPGPSSDPGARINTITTDTSIDLTDFIEHNGSGRYSVSVRAKLGNVISSPGQEVKYYYRIEVYPAFKALGESYPEIGTTGGTVAPEAASGDEFTGPDDNGKYTGLFAEGDKIIVTSTPADNYRLAEMYDGSTKITPVQEEYGFIVEHSSYINACFWENEPDPVTVTLDMGSGHEDFAAAVLAAYKEAYADEVDVDQASLDGFVLTLLIPYPATTVANGRDFLEELIEDVIAGDMMDEGEYFFNIGTDTIDGYSSMSDYYDKMSETYSQDLEDGQEYHALWFKMVDKVELNAAPPVCGTEVTMEGYDPRTVSSQPELSVTDDVFKVLQMQMSMDPTDTMPYVFWAGENGQILRDDTILGGQTYRVRGYLEATFGFVLSEDATITFNGEELTDGEDYIREGSTHIVLSAPIEAEHDPDDWEPKEGDPTREVQKCKHCGEVLDERDATVTVTLIPSPMDGSKPVENYTLTIPYGWSTGAFFNNNPDVYQAARSHFNVDGYSLFDDEIYLLDNPYSSFSSSSEVSEADRWNLVITEDTTFYVAMDTIISEVDVTVESPICGQETIFEVDGYYVLDPDAAVNLPSVTIETEGVAPYDYYEDPQPMVFWWVPEDGTDYTPVFNGTFEGGKSYGVVLQLETVFGYEFDADNVKVKANGATAETEIHSGSHYYYDVIALVQAEHDWGEWETVTEPTETEEGLKRRTCKHCGETEEEPIPPLGGETYTITFDPNGGTLKGSTSPVSKEYDEGEVITIMDAPTREGYKFLYWKGSEYQPGDKYEVVGNHTFVAQWEKIEIPEKKATPKSGGTDKKAEDKAKAKAKAKVPGTGDPATLSWTLALAGAGASSAVAAYLRRREQR